MHQRSSDGMKHTFSAPGRSQGKMFKKHSSKCNNMQSHARNPARERTPDQHTWPQSGVLSTGYARCSPARAAPTAFSARLRAAERSFMLPAPVCKRTRGMSMKMLRAGHACCQACVVLKVYQIARHLLVLKMQHPKWSQNCTYVSDHVAGLCNAGYCFTLHAILHDAQVRARCTESARIPRSRWSSVSLATLTRLHN